MSKSAAPQMMSLSAEELEKLLVELRGPLAPATYQLVEALLRTLQWVMTALEQKTASLARLRRTIFGEKTEKAPRPRILLERTCMNHCVVGSQIF